MSVVECKCVCYSDSHAHTPSPPFLAFAHLSFFYRVFSARPKFVECTLSTSY